MNPRAPLWTVAMIFLVIKLALPDGSAEAVFALMYQVVLLCIFISWISEKVRNSIERQTQKVWYDHRPK